MHTSMKERKRRSPDKVNKDLNSGQNITTEFRLHNALANMRAWFRDDIMGMKLKVKRSDRSRHILKRYRETRRYRA